MGEDIENDESDVKCPISSKISLQTPVKVLHSQCLDPISLKVRLKEEMCWW